MTGRKQLLPKILFMKQFYGKQDIKRSVVQDPTILKRSWYRLSRIKFYKTNVQMVFGPWDPFHVVKWNSLVMQETFPEYRDYLIKKNT
eukprot:UN11612